VFFLVFVAVVSLGCLVFIAKWSLSPPNGPFDGTARVLAGTVAGALLAFWIVAASIAPQLNEDARMNATNVTTPSEAQARTLFDDIVLSAPIGVDIATAIGAGAGFVIALASVGSYRRAT
jgi:hypothetical protein